MTTSRPHTDTPAAVDDIPVVSQYMLVPRPLLPSPQNGVAKRESPPQRFNGNYGDSKRQPSPSSGLSLAPPGWVDDPSNNLSHFFAFHPPQQLHSQPQRPHSRASPEQPTMQMHWVDEELHSPDADIHRWSEEQRDALQHFYFDHSVKARPPVRSLQSHRDRARD